MHKLILPLLRYWVSRYPQNSQFRVISTITEPRIFGRDEADKAIEYFLNLEEDTEASIWVETNDDSYTPSQISEHHVIGQLVDTALANGLHKNSVPASWSPTIQNTDAEAILRLLQSAGYDYSILHTGNGCQVKFGEKAIARFDGETHISLAHAICAATLELLTTINSLPTKTSEEITELKQNWYNDPCWEIETTEGFEAHRIELYQYRKECESAWDKEAARKEQQFASEIGLTTNAILARYLQNLERRVKTLESKH